MPEKTTHFGYQEVTRREKTAKVSAVFDAVAGKYDLMNDLMSMGLHRVWKHYFVHIANLRPHHQVLDLAAGSGDVAVRLAPRLGPKGGIFICDPNAAMLARARQRLTDQGRLQNIHYVQAQAEALCFRANHFDRVTLAFGLRNFTDKEQALRSIYKLIKPGGQLLILEFSRPQKWLRGIYAGYLSNALPRMGEIIAKDAASYRYLAESIHQHPRQQQLQSMLEAVGFECCDFLNLSSGIVCVHRGYKLSV